MRAVILSSHDTPLGLPGITEGAWQMEELTVNLVNVTSFGHRA